MLARILFEKSSRSLFDLLFPPRCVNCKSANSWLCEDCLARIPFITSPVCRRCGAPLAIEARSLCQQCSSHPLPAIDGIRAAASFEDNPLREAIHAFKYGNQKVIAPVLADMLVDTYRRHQLSAQVIVPVPLHASRLRERGYNQSELLAREAGRLLGIPVNTRVLQRIRKTKSQMTLGANERHQNVIHAFSCMTKNEELAGKNVLLIDDVCTTGSTLDACAAALKEGEAASVWGLTLARAH